MYRSDMQPQRGWDPQVENCCSFQGVVLSSVTVSGRYPPGTFLSILLDSVPCGKRFWMPPKVAAILLVEDTVIAEAADLPLGLLLTRV